jgi:uncharacterized membrane protein
MKGTPLPRSGISQTSPASPSILDRIGEIILLSWDFILLGLLSATLLMLIFIDANGFSSLLLAPLRIGLGLVFVLFVPGYALQAALFPGVDDLDGIERLGLSTGLSVALIPALALLLNWLPWGLRLWPIVISLVMVTVVFSLAALVRRWMIPTQERYIPSVDFHIKGWWATQERTNRRLYALLSGTLVVALLSAGMIAILPRSGERFTEFYMLGSDGLAESYPRQSTAGQPLDVTIGIRNQEGVAASYRVEAQDGQGLIGQAGPFSLKTGEQIEAPLTFTPQQTGDDVLVTISLFRDNQSEPYRTLKLWLKVESTP